MERPPAGRIGNYELLRELGRGGMGVVWAARSLKLGREVAIKVLGAGEVGPRELARFEREARAAAALRHPNIAFVHHVGHEGGRPFIVMDLVPGGSLATHLSRVGPLEPREAARIAARLARALEHAHARGVLHRDVKPGNVLLDGRGEPVLADFGLARELGAQERLTTTGTVIGTPTYMAPEQADGGSTADERADVYALGATLFELLTGRPPYVGRGVIEVLTQVLRSPAPSPAQLQEGIPPELDRTVLACLAKQPQDRPRAGDLAERLERWLAGPVEAPPRPSVLGPLIIAASILGAGGLVAAAVLHGGSGPETRPPPEAAARDMPDLSPVPTPAGAITPETEELLQAREAYGRANQRAQAGDLSGALEEYARALALAPRLVQAHVNRANVHQRRGDLPAGLADLDRALELDPDFPLARLNRGTMRLAHGEVAAALDDLTRAIELCDGRPIPERWGVDGQELVLPRALAMRGAGQVKLGRRAEAVADLSRAARLAGSDSRTWVQIALARSELGDREAARHAFTHMIELEPGNVAMRILRSRVQDDQRARVADLEAAIALAEPGSPLAREAEGELERLRR